MNSLFFIHPIDRDLQFLSKVIKDIKKVYPQNTHYLKLKNSDISHNKCISRIKEASENDLIFFMCHGGTSYLDGCNYVDKDNISYHKSRFINKHNINILKNKKVICFACNSNKNLLKMAIEAEAKVFVGFGNVRFDDENHILSSSNTQKRITNHSKHELAKLLKSTMLFCLENEVPFKLLTKLMKLQANKQYSSMILKNSNFKNRRRVANFIKQVVTDMVIDGDLNLKVIE